MTLRTNSFTTPFVALVALLLNTQALAGTAGIVEGQQVEYLYQTTHVIPPLSMCQIETSELSAGADTIIHVQNMDGSYLDGNDDCATRLSGCVGLRSYLTVSNLAGFASKQVRIIVRAYSAQSKGTAFLSMLDVPSNKLTKASIAVNAGYKKTFTSFKAQSHFLTTEEQGGTPDTILLVTSGAVANAIAFDDNNGVGLMSWTHVNTACTTVCQVIVGARNQSGTTTFIWDEDIHDNALNCDMDGMSDALEASAGTNPCVKDTDRDGIDDDKELMGVDGAGFARTRYPYFGANPLVKDIFVEADWEECVVRPGQTCVDGTGNPNIDLYQIPYNEIEHAANYYGPDIIIHVDNGMTNNASTTRFLYGNWGGASRFPEAEWSDDKCDHLSSERAASFHGGRFYGASGGQGDQPGRCFNAGIWSISFGHELGHNFNLSHGAGQDGGLDINCKPNYKSIMSYCYSDDRPEQYVHAFSRNEFAGLVLNPTAMDESLGVGTTDPDLLSALRQPSFAYDIRADGAIDWNRDGEINLGLVRAAPTWGFNGTGNEMTGYQYDREVSPLRSMTALAWYKGVAKKLFWFTKRDSDKKIEYRIATSFPDNCSTPPSASCVTNWMPAISSDATLLSTSVAGDGAPAAAPAGSKLMLAYFNASRVLTYQLYSEPFLGRGVWTAPQTVGSPTVFADAGSSPALVAHGDAVYAYVVSGGHLYEWTYTVANQSWSSGSAQWWTDAEGYNVGLVSAAYGIGVASAWFETNGDVEPLIVAAIPKASPMGEIEIAVRGYGGQWWERQGEGIYGGYAYPTTVGQPGMAFVPFDKSASVNDGRIYLAWNRGTDQSGQIAFTEGNSRDGVVRRFVFVQPSHIYNVWSDNYANSNISLEYDAAVDNNLRMAFSFIDRWPMPHNLTFMPIADGIFNGEIRDQDDYGVLADNLGCPFAADYGSCFR